MKLVIVESPTKARTISQYLGGGFRVVSSYGHVRDLPKSKLGVDTEHDFEPQYVIPTKVRKRVNELKQEAKETEGVVLATDEDREGEAIAWHIAQVLADLGNPKSKTLNPKTMERIVFHEITKQAIEEALKHPRTINLKLVDAQQARRVLDRLVGYNLSPFLWKKIARGLSAGRVQSVTLRLIVERERERRAFKPQEYWSIIAVMETRNPRLHQDYGGQAKSEIRNFEAQLIEYKGEKLEKFDIQNEDAAKKIIDALKNAEWVVTKAETQERKMNPLPPFRTSTLQQEAARRLGFSAKQTMMVAQQLYEGMDIGEKTVGLITYMRTDSANLSGQFLAATQKLLKTQLGAPYAQGPRAYTSAAKRAQEAHEAIRPTDPFVTPEALKGKIAPRNLKLYDLIWRRAIASQMPEARLSAKTIVVRATAKTDEDGVFRATGSTVIFDGFMKIWPVERKEAELPETEEGEALSCRNITPVQHFTEPPPRFTEASLIKTLEQNGIGRPSTYAPILSVVQERGYVAKDEARRLSPSELGEHVNDLLVEHFPKLVDISFTASMEKELDEIAEGAQTYASVLKQFWVPFSAHVAEKIETVDEQKMEEPTDEQCPSCGKPMVMKLGRFGRFLACTGFPECKTTKSTKEHRTDVSCPNCKKGELVAKRTHRGKIFYGCSSYPECDFALWDKPNGKVCPECHSLVVMKRNGEQCSNKTCKWLPLTAIG